MSTSYSLVIDIRSFWHAGGGRDAGSVLDAVVHRDKVGLPVLPGRHLKGLLRDACQRAEAWGWNGFNEGTTASLFGDKTENPDVPHPQPGGLRFSDGTLPTALADWLSTDDGQALLPGLFTGIYSTAIDQKTKIAKDHSLRGIEVTVPLQLESKIFPIPGKTLPPEWEEKIDQLLPLIDAVGGQRSRGLGRANLRREENS